MRPPIEWAKIGVAIGKIEELFLLNWSGSLFVSGGETQAINPLIVKT
ncbi:hypothetical protein CEV32_4140 [Brucella rhizosphaerae]|uniref:Uncharacterized protein n=1 Tax=Brucella rhizosphaerae TaxID=571254 RepID=A0A256FPI3_9HYPH|nr:hypothetical protein CEV32_4140 [Brucella rhizosphaerae]